MSTGCECDTPGYCPRHRCRKTVFHHHLCQADAALFARWETGNGPGQSPPAATIPGVTAFQNPVPPCHARTDGNRTASRPLSVAVVVLSHNYGRFLTECLESVLRQSRRPEDILVVDDASDDDTDWVARQFAPRVRYLRVNVRNVHAARREGMEATRADVLCFLDADDLLGDHYLEEGLKAFQASDIAVAYSDLSKFGATHGRSDFPMTYDRGRLACDNFIHAGSLVLREALVQTQAFEKPIDPLITQADWFLWRQVLQGSWRAEKQAGLYRYRQHGTNWTHAMRRAASGYYEYAGLAHEVITLCLPLSGRREAWELCREFLTRQAWPHTQVRLLLLDTSQQPAFSAAVRDWLAHCDYPDVHYRSVAVARPGLADEDRQRDDVQQAVRLAMARIYNAIASSRLTDYVWILEDDVVPPDDACERLLRGFDETTASVSAVYPSRFDQQPCVWDQHRQHYRTSSPGLQAVHGNGFGCVVLRRGVLQRTAFRHHDDFDRLFYDELAVAGWTTKVDWSVACQHGTAPLTSARTGCECPTAGWCPRHRCLKTVMQHHLCRTEPERFGQWERDRAQQSEEAATFPTTEPGLLRKAWNFGKAVVRHVADGGRDVSDEEFFSRLAVCKTCESCDVPRMVCREQSCGCQLYVKARWHSENCPQGKWPRLESP